MTKKIFILDDEKEYVNSLRNFLSEFKYKVDIAYRANQALEIIKTRKPDIVLFDYKMPDMDGEDFLRKAKRVSPSAVFIMITAWHDPHVISKMKELGTAEVVIKPVDLNELMAKIEIFLTS